MRYLKILFLSFLILSADAFAQESAVDAPSNLDKLLELVKEGKTKEQSENTKLISHLLFANLLAGEITIIFLFLHY